MSDILRSVRKSHGITVSELAGRLGVTQGAISQLEESERNGTIKMKTLQAALGAMGTSLVLTTVNDGPYADFVPPALASSLSAALKRGETAYALRLLTEAADAIRHAYDEFGEGELEISPPPLPDQRWDQLFRALYREAIPSRSKPAWTETSRLDEPWFPSEYRALRERAKTTSPDFLRKLNIFIDARSLQRA